MAFGGGSLGLRKSKCHSNLQEGQGNLGNYMLVSLTTIPGRMKEQLILETISKYIKDKKVTGEREGQIMLDLNSHLQ